MNKNQIQKIRKEIASKERECMMSNCAQNCINSHVVQESRYLKPLANQKGELKITDSLTTYPGNKPKFISKTTKKVLSFKGFCHFHDELIFAEIEKQPIDFTSYRHLILLNYRAICHEQRKKEKASELIRRLLELIDPSNEELYSFYDNLQMGMLIGGNELNNLKLRLEKEIINNDQNNFALHTESIEAIEVVSSAIFTLQTRTEEPQTEEEVIRYFLEPEPSIISTIIPADGITKIIMCTEIEQENSLKEFISKYQGNSKTMLNDILLQYAETWACSIAFYESKIRHNEDRIIDIMTTQGLFNEITENLDAQII